MLAALALCYMLLENGPKVFSCLAMSVTIHDRSWKIRKSFERRAVLSLMQISKDGLQLNIKKSV